MHSILEIRDIIIEINKYLTCSESNHLRIASAILNKYIPRYKLQQHTYEVRNINFFNNISYFNEKCGRGVSGGWISSYYNEDIGLAEHENNSDFEKYGSLNDIHLRGYHLNKATFNKAISNNDFYMIKLLIQSGRKKYCKTSQRTISSHINDISLSLFILLNRNNYITNLDSMIKTLIKNSRMDLLEYLTKEGRII